VDEVDGCENRRIAIANSLKPDLLVLDLVGNSKHKIVTCSDILGGNYDVAVAARADRKMRESGVPCNVIESLEQIQRDRNEEIRREAERKDALALRKKSASKFVDPFELLGVESVPGCGWDDERPIDSEQAARLTKWGVGNLDKMNYVQAERLTAQCLSRARRGLATFKQVKMLVWAWRMTPAEARNMSFERAGKLMKILAANNWERPKEYSHA
jgi:hypothetical protein